MKKADVAKKMKILPDLKTKGEYTFKEHTERHTNSRNTPFNPFCSYCKKGKASLNPVQKSKDNMVMESKNEVENN